MDRADAIHDCFLKIYGKFQHFQRILKERPLDSFIHLLKINFKGHGIAFPWSALHCM